jgi:surface antigen/LysM repeat protein
LSRWYSSHFPAIHLKNKLDNWDYALNFSSEMLATGLVMLVVICSLFAFGSPFSSSSKEHDLSDNSLAGRLLSYHTKLNAQLYNKMNSIKTTVVNQDGFIPAAQASNEALSPNDTASSETPADASNDSADVKNNSLVESSPDTVRGLMNKLVIVYVSEPGDTLGSIAKKFNLSIDTIKQVNHLPNNSMKPGWNLRILPVDGVLYKIAANDTGPDIAKYFGVNLDTIVAYNGLESDLDFEAGQEIIIPGGKVPAPVAPPAPKAAKSGKKIVVPAGAIPRNGLYAKGHNFVSGQCTDYIARVYATNGAPIPWGGNARDWDTTAAAYATVNRTPTVGSIIQFEAGNGHSRYGHVGIVESIHGSTVTYSEWNGPGGPFHKTISSASISSAKYIHYKGH